MAALTPERGSLWHLKSEGIFEMMYWQTKQGENREYGFDRKFATPYELWIAACEYFDWITKHPLKEEQLFHYKGAVKEHEAKKMRPFTKKGMCAYLGVTLTRYENIVKEEDFHEVDEMIGQIIWSQKFEGAAAGLMNPIIIAREMGLADKQELSGPNGGPIESEVSPKDVLADRLALILERRGAQRATGEPDGSGSE